MSELHFPQSQDDGTVTITFDYGINQGLMEKNSFNYDGTKFTGSIKVPAGKETSLYEIMQTYTLPE